MRAALGDEPGGDKLADPAAIGVILNGEIGCHVRGYSVMTNMEQPADGVRSLRSGHEPLSEQRLAADRGTAPAPRGGREGAPARSATWTAAATSRAVSASTTMFRRSRTRRTTCPAYGSASCGPMAAWEGPVASGSVTLGTVGETVLARLLNTPALQHVFQRPASCDRVLGGQKLIMSGIVRFSTGRIPGGLRLVPQPRWTLRPRAWPPSPLRPVPDRLTSPNARECQCLMRICV